MESDISQGYICSSGHWFRLGRTCISPVYSHFCLAQTQLGTFTPVSRGIYLVDGVITLIITRLM